jgi:hypothetical protein
MKSSEAALEKKTKKIIFAIALYWFEIFKIFDFRLLKY